MKKIALVMYGNALFGGAERRFVRIYNEIGKRHHIDVYAYCGNQDILDRSLKLADCRAENISNFYFENRVGMLFKILKGKYDYVHFFDASLTNFVLSFFLRLARTKVILTIADCVQAYGNISGVLRVLLYWTLKNADKIDVLYPNRRKYIENLSKGTVTATPGTFTNLEVFKPAEKVNSIVFCAARLEKEKGTQLLIDGLPLCAEELRESGYKVYILGKDYEEEKIREIITAYDIGDVVQMTGYVNPSDYVSSARVYLALDELENWPAQSLAEAVACGCYIIATNVGATSEMVGNGFSTLISNSPQELADAIKEYFSKTNKDEIISIARDFAEKHFCIDKSVKYFTDLIE